ncbi:MAG: hypothetical protein Q4D57_02495 [Clostridia bacterium]|nr:hypothetical protein [Clostridia bacterium]
MKKYLSILLSCAILFQPIAASANQVQEENQYYSVSSQEKSKSKPKLSPKTKKTLKKVGIATGAIGGAKLVLDVSREINFSSNCNYLNGHYEKISSGMLKKIDNPYGDDIKRQEGAGWCWNACLQRALSKYGIERTQKEIFRGVAEKWWVSPYKFKRDCGHDFNETVKELVDNSPYIIRLLFIPNCVFTQDIEKWVAKTTNSEYTYQTLTIPSEYLSPGSSEFDPKVASNKMYNLFEIMRNKIARKQGIDVKNVMLITLCPIFSSGHAITIEGTEDDKFIIGEPTGAATVGLSRENFFSKPVGKPIPFIFKCDFKEGFPVYFVIKKGHEITPQEWDKMLEEADFKHNYYKTVDN